MTSIYRKQLPFSFTTQAFHEIVSYEVSQFQALKSKMQLVIVSSECKITLKRKLQEKDIAQELIID
jgi:hypothetical protein